MNVFVSPCLHEFICFPTQRRGATKVAAQLVVCNFFDVFFSLQGRGATEQLGFFDVSFSLFFDVSFSLQGRGATELLHDLFLMPLGPNLRARLSHGD